MEPRTAALIETFMPEMRCIHVRLGDLVLQFIRPGKGMDSWSEQLEREGPSVHNVAYSVEDSRSLGAALVARGGTLLNEFTDVDMSDAGLEARGFTTLLVDAREQIGLRLELIGAGSKWPGGSSAP